MSEKRALVHVSISKKHHALLRQISTETGKSMAVLLEAMIENTVGPPPAEGEGAAPVEERRPSRYDPRCSEVDGTSCFGAIVPFGARTKCTKHAAAARAWLHAEGTTN
jgi:hypothetical protein